MCLGFKKVERNRASLTLTPVNINGHFVNDSYFYPFRIGSLVFLKENSNKFYWGNKLSAGNIKVNKILPSLKEGNNLTMETAT